MTIKDDIQRTCRSHASDSALDAVPCPQWAPARIVASLVAENTVLTFFHVTKDVDPLRDNDEINTTMWTNWCGPRVRDIGTDYLTPKQTLLLENALTHCQNTSEEVAGKLAAAESDGQNGSQDEDEGSEQQNGNGNGNAKSSSSRVKLGTNKPPAYVFQILGSKDSKIHFTWPPPVPTGEHEDTLLHGDPADGEERYSPAEYAGLAKGVLLKPREKASDDAQTNCTKRFQSKHPM